MVPRWNEMRPEEQPIKSTATTSSGFQAAEGNETRSLLTSSVLEGLGLTNEPGAPDTSVTSLIEDVRQGSWRVRMVAVRALGLLGAQAPVPVLVEALRDEEEVVRAAAIQALGLLGEQISLDVFQMALSDSHRFVRAAAVRALAMQGERVPNAWLESSCNDADESVRLAAENALRQRGEQMQIHEQASDRDTREGSVFMEELPREQVRQPYVATTEVMDNSSPHLTVNSRNSPFRGRDSNQPLKIFWQGSNPDLITRNLELDRKPVKQNILLRETLTAELEDLLCKLFYEAGAIVVEPMAAGHSGTGVLKVQPFYPMRGGGQKVVVKFGDVQMIEREYTNYTKYVRFFIGDGHNTAFLASRRTRHLGGIVCSFVGASIDHVQNFGTFYHQQSASEVASVLGRLLHQTCGSWYVNHRSLWPLDLTKDYQRLFRYSSRRIESAISTHLQSLQCKEEQLPKRVKHAGVFKLMNPLPLVAAAQPFVRPTYVCTTHGDLNPYNLFVDSNRHCWLIDFQSTGPGHILRDLAMLDSVVRFQLLLPGEASLEERCAMEEALCSITAFSEVEQLKTRFSTENAALAKSYSTVVYLRTLAQEIMGKNLSNDMSEYYIALLYNALNTLR